jgi:hypothetical protein
MLIADAVTTRCLRHVVEFQMPVEETGEKMTEMRSWCVRRLRSQDWADRSRSEGPCRYAQFRFRESAVADEFATAFRRACPVRCRG